MNIYTYPTRRYLVQYQWPAFEKKHESLELPTVCDCGEPLPAPSEGWVKNHDCDSGGLYVICPKCSMQWWQVIDEPRGE